METPNYNEFKTGIKRDINNVVSGFAFHIGFLLLIVAIASLGIFLASKYSPFNTVGKIVSSGLIVLFVLLMIFNKRIGNSVLILWLRLLVIIPILAFTAFAGWFIYMILKAAFKDMF